MYIKNGSASKCTLCYTMEKFLKVIQLYCCLLLCYPRNVAVKGRDYHRSGFQDIFSILFLFRLWRRTQMIQEETGRLNNNNNVNLIRIYTQ